MKLHHIILLFLLAACTKKQEMKIPDLEGIWINDAAFLVFDDSIALQPFTYPCYGKMKIENKLLIVASTCQSCTGVYQESDTFSIGLSELDTLTFKPVGKTAHNSVFREAEVKFTRLVKNNNLNLKSLSMTLTPGDCGGENVDLYIDSNKFICKEYTLDGVKFKSVDTDQEMWEVIQNMAENLPFDKLDRRSEWITVSSSEAYMKLEYNNDEYNNNIYFNTKTPFRAWLLQNYVTEMFQKGVFQSTTKEFTFSTREELKEHKTKLFEELNAR